MPTTIAMSNDNSNPAATLEGWSDDALYAALLHTSVDLDDLGLPQQSARLEPPSCAENSLRAVLLDLDLPHEALSDAQEGSSSTRSDTRFHYYSDESPVRVESPPVRVISEDDSYDSGSSGGGGRKRRRSYLQWVKLGIEHNRGCRGPHDACVRLT